MKQLPPDYTQTIYQWWDTIGDIFHDPIILKTLKDFKRFCDFWKWDTEGFTDGDLIIYIFRDDDRTEKFLQFVRINIKKVNDVPKIITLVLA